MIDQNDRIERSGRKIGKNVKEFAITRFVERTAAPFALPSRTEQSFVLCHADRNGVTQQKRRQLFAIHELLEFQYVLDERRSSGGRKGGGLPVGVIQDVVVAVHRKRQSAP